MKIRLNEVLTPTPLPRSREAILYEMDIATIRAASYSEMAMGVIADDLHAMYYATLAVAAWKEAAQLKRMA